MIYTSGNRQDTIYIWRFARRSCAAYEKAKKTHWGLICAGEMNVIRVWSSVRCGNTLYYFIIMDNILTVISLGMSCCCSHITDRGIGSCMHAYIYIYIPNTRFHFSSVKTGWWNEVCDMWRSFVKMGFANGMNRGRNLWGRTASAAADAYSVK